MSVIAQVEGRDEGLVLRWQDGKESSFPWFWLRDHGQDPDSLDPDTLQRRVDTFGLDEGIRATGTEILDGGRGLAVTWPNGDGASRYAADFLAAMAGVATVQTDVRRLLPQRLWSAEAPPAPVEPVAYSDIGEGLEGLRPCIEAIQRDGYVVIAGAPTDEASARALFRRFGYIRETIFGGLWSLSAELKEHDDTAYTTQYLEPHTDATYSHDAPGLQSFLCQAFDGKGGESILVDGFALAEAMRRDAPELFRVLCEVPVPGRYVEPGVHLRAERPVFRLNHQGHMEQVSINNYDRAPFLLASDRMKEFYRAYRDFHARIVARDNWLTVPLRPGMALIFDNWRLLHGRMGYSGKRVFCGCYHNHEDFESALRTLSSGS
ncbi:MAG: TauD/TfdA family dioxygenase [Kiloniellaceae bacterium]